MPVRESRALTTRSGAVSVDRIRDIASPRLRGALLRLGSSFRGFGIFKRANRQLLGVQVAHPFE